MSIITPQITVLVSIVGSDENAEVFYSYEDHASGQAVIKARSCLLDAPVPYFTLFSLDYASSQDGWTFVDLSPKPGGTAPSYSVSNNTLSLVTLDEESEPLRFDLSFLNVTTNKTKNDDPQENNVPKPK